MAVLAGSAGALVFGVIRLDEVRLFLRTDFLMDKGDASFQFVTEGE
jgi:hypothetical protein